LNKNVSRLEEIHVVLKARNVFMENVNIEYFLERKKGVPCAFVNLAIQESTAMLQNISFI